jgi:autotransporter-associated beta strand protein
MLAPVTIGMNLEVEADYTAAWMFTDAFKGSAPWAADGGTVSLDSRGWPTQLNQYTNGQGLVVTQRLSTRMFSGLAGHYPAGVYHAEWDGSATLLWQGDAAVAQTGTTAQGRHFADLNVTPGNGGIQLQVTAITAGDPVKNINVWLPDYNGQHFAGQRWTPGANFSPFHPLFLQRLQPFHPLRFMQTMETCASTVVSWSDRRPWDYATQVSAPGRTGVANGVAPEYLIELANELQADPWFCMPHKADSTYVTNFATQVRDTLSPNLRAYVEWSNEAWNAAPGYAAYPWLNQQLTLPENAGKTMFQVWAQEASADFALWSQVFAGQTSRVVRVLAGQNGNSWVAGQVAQSMGGNFDAIAVAPYVGVNPSQYGSLSGSTTPDQVLDLAATNIPGVLSGLQAHKVLTDQYSASLGRPIRLITYEGGLYLPGRGQPWQQAFFDASHSPRTYELMRTILRGVLAAGVDTYVHFTYMNGGISPTLTEGDGSIIRWQDQPIADAPKYQALLDAISGQVFMPEVSIQAVTPSASELGPSSAVLQLTRTGDVSTAINVSYQVGGNPTSGDRAALPAVIVMPAGQATVNVTFTPPAETFVEGDRTLRLTLIAGSGYTVSAAANQATISIADKDSLTVANLPIQNPSFETGNFTGWTLQPASGNYNVVVRQLPGQAASDPPPAPHQGSYYVWGGGADGMQGGGANPAALAQRIDLSDHAAAIDNGHATLTCTGWGAGLGTGQQSSALDLQFYDGANTALGSRVASNVAVAKNTWTQLSISTAVPTGARNVELRALTQRPTSSWGNRAGFDDISAVLTYSRAMSWNGQDDKWNSNHWTGAPPFWPGTAADAIINAAHTVTVDSSQAARALAISGGGRVRIASGGNLAADSGVVLGAGGVMDLLTGGTLTVSNLTKVEDSAIFNADGGTMKAGNALSTDLPLGLLAGGITVDTNGFDVALRGPLRGGTGSGGLSKIGLGTLTLSAANDFSGGTFVSSGTLLLTSANALPAGGNLTIGPGATVVLASGLALAGARDGPGPTVADCSQPGVSQPADLGVAITVAAGVSASPASHEPQSPSPGPVAAARARTLQLSARDSFFGQLALLWEAEQSTSARNAKKNAVAALAVDQWLGTSST